MASIRPSVCSATATALSPGMFITRTPAAVAASRSTKSVPTPAKAMTRSFFADVDLRRRDFREARCDQDFRVGQMLRVLGGAGRNDLPAGLSFQDVDSRCTQRLCDYDLHGSLKPSLAVSVWRLRGVILLDGGHARAQLYWNTVRFEDQLQFGYQGE